MSGETTPLNPRLPLVVYRGVLESGPGAAASCETLFAGNGWSGGWRGGVYPYHHYHSTAHEALGIVAGSAKVRLGGDSGTLIDLHAGDVVVIPAGVAHKGEAASPDLLIVGAYPGGRSGHAGPRQRRPRAGTCQYSSGAAACHRSGVRQVRAADRAPAHRRPALSAARSDDESEITERAARGFYHRGRISPLR